MIQDLIKYFMPKYTFYLNSIEFNRIEDQAPVKDLVFTCTDTISADLKEDSKVEVILTRHVACEPKGLFDITVSFGAVLTLNPERIEDYQWKDINLAEEFTENGDFVISNLLNRITLLIGQITSAAGQSPLILPSSIGAKK